MIVNPALAATRPSPVVEAKRWIADKTFAPDLPLLNVSQAAPVDPPPVPLREAMAETALTLPAAHVYGPVLGLPALREEVAAQFSTAYGGTITPGNVAITQGCNQAFCAAVATLAGPGDEVILPTPWYFNHQMWLTLSGVTPVALPAGEEMLPTVAEAEARLTDRTRAIVLVTPNNPAGVEYPADLVHAFANLARRAGIALIVDETYRDFDSRPGAPHDLFTAPDWSDTVIQLYSFSKAYRLTGHRVGAMVASPERLLAAEKFLDTVAICPNQLGQHAALWGMQNLGRWLAGERDEILARRAAVEDGVIALPGWEIAGAGAYFAYVRHPFDESSASLARRMVDDIAVLALPGTMFTPDDDPAGAAHLRIAFANIDRDGIATLMERLARLS
ncbi:aminotransferase [Maritimibacter sp. DP07]|uniref:aspartate transaminase n=1 Tax=Maritimibacter harenae TaxID=2606218 RepID=A0A845M303_9RHOB|nr:aminotransferase [Maritimibacter harenae]MZR13946.1 aminotransferase [Maritimibacter harenae]